MIKKFTENFITKNGRIREEAINESLIGLRIFDEPIIGYASAEDEIFKRYVEDEKIIYGKFMPPKEWMEGIKTIISIFFPYSKEVKRGNSRDMKFPSKEWLYARYEGQKIIDSCTESIVNMLIKNECHAMSLSLDKRFLSNKGTSIEDNVKNSNERFYSNWSERHIAYASGLGTFGLSKGLITKNGVAGRFTSIITDYEHPANIRNYEGIYDYCSMCGKCIENCPVNAISLEKGKDHTRCSNFLDFTGKKFKPRYRCGKCQVGVPCESIRPQKK